MRLLRPVLPGISLLLLAMSICIIASSVGCTKDQRQTTISASLVSLNAARDQFTEWDKTHQQAIVDQSTTRTELVEKLTVYRSVERPKYVEAFEVAYRLLALAATQTDDLSLSAALARSGILIELVAKLVTGPPEPVLAPVPTVAPVLVPAPGVP